MFFNFVIFMMTAFAQEGSSANVRVRHVEPDPEGMGIAVLVSVEDSSGMPLEYSETCQGDKCKDTFKVRVSSSSRPTTDIHEAIQFKDYERGFDTLFLIDGSGSMHDYWSNVQASVKSYLDSKNPQDRVAIYTFTDEVYDVNGNKLLPDGQSARKIQWKDNKESLLKDVSQMGYPKGGTEIFKSLRDVFRSLKLETGEPTFRTIILLTDGVEGRIDRPSEYNTVVNWAQTAKVPINVVQFVPGSGGKISIDDKVKAVKHGRLLQDLSEDTLGRAKAINDVSDISKEFRTIRKRVHETWMIKTIVCNLHAGLHDVSVRTFDGKTETGFDSSTFMLDSDLFGPEHWCDATGSSQDAFVTSEKLNKQTAFLGVVLCLCFGAVYTALGSRRQSGDLLRKDLEQLRHALSQMNHAIAGRDEEIVEKNEVQNLQSQIAKFQGQVKNLESQIQSLTSQETMQAQHLESQPATRATSTSKHTQLTRTPFLNNLKNKNQKIPLFMNLGESLAIGSGSDCDIPLMQEGVSKLHVTLLKRGDGLLVTDEHSDEGTFIDGDMMPKGGQILIPTGEEASLKFGQSDVFVLTW